MPVYQGTYWSKTVVLRNSSDNTAVNISGWEFEMHVRNDPDDVDALLELTTGNGGIIVSDGANGELQIVLLAADTSELPEGFMHFDVLRTDSSPAPIWLFGGKFKVRQPVTR